MTIRIAFWAFLLSTLATITILGGRDERRFARFIFCAAAATFAFDRILGIRNAYRAVAVVDACLLVVAVYYVAKSDRYWPVWFAGFQAITVSTELGSILFPGAMPGLYIDAAGFWALPALIAMTIGVWRDHRAEEAGRLPFRENAIGG